jgi:hypothetical protein
MSIARVWPTFPSPLGAGRACTSIRKIAISIMPDPGCHFVFNPFSFFAFFMCPGLESWTIHLLYVDTSTGI